eukprot:3369256-Amphidinium_carterae.1
MSATLRYTTKGSSKKILSSLGIVRGVCCLAASSSETEKTPETEIPGNSHGSKRNPHPRTEPASHSQSNWEVDQEDDEAGVATSRHGSAFSRSHAARKAIDAQQEASKALTRTRWILNTIQLTV